MWNDNDTHIDLIDYKHLVGAVTGLIENDNLIPCTIGVFGDWGSGKSSLMKMIEAEFEEEDEVLIIKFNGWLFEGYDDAKTALMSTIVEQLIQERTLSEKAKKLVKGLFKRIDWLKVAKQGVSHGISYLTTGGIGNVLLGLNDLNKSGAIEQAKAIATEFKDGDYDKVIDKIKTSATEEDPTLQMGIRDFHLKFGELLKETKVQKLIVFIDDLDRCTPDTIIATLEAIKLFLFIERSAFVISADERLIKYAVRKRFPEIPGDAAEVGRDYLEKLIQFPLRIPSLSESELETYINLLFTSLYIDKEKFEKLREEVLIKKNDNLFGSVFSSGTVTDFLKKEDIPDELIEDLGLSSQITSVLATGLAGNPRQCKRFLNTLIMRVSMAKTRAIDLDKKILAKLMLLEYFKPETFRELSKFQNLQEGKPKEIIEIEANLKNQNEENDAKSNERFDSWLKDIWLNQWFKSKPKLANIDLRPYFFFSRDNLNVFSIESSRMSSAAQEVYLKLINDSEAFNRNGIKEIEGLSPADSASIFGAMVSEIRSSSDKARIGKMLNTLCAIVEIRTELLSELISFISTFPESNLKAGIVPQLKKATKGEQNQAVRNEIFTKWSKSEKNTRLAKAASNALK